MVIATTKKTGRKPALVARIILFVRVGRIRGQMAGGWICYRRR
jgi:hypothetical protein